MPACALQFMCSAGDVKLAQVIRYPDGRSKSWGLVEFSDPSFAAQAIATLNDVDLMGRKIFIREDREQGDAGAVGLPPPGGIAAGAGGMAAGRAAGGRGGKRAGGGGRGGSRAKPPLEAPAEEPSSGTALFVGNLPWSTTSQQLREVFSCLLYTSPSPRDS